MNLNQVTIPVSDVEKSLDFYERLGLKLIVKSLPNYARFECPEGDSTFSIHRVSNSQKESGTAVYFEIKNLDSYVRQLIDQGIEFDELPDDKSWLWRESRLRDPDNNQIILYFAGNNRKYPPWRVE
jgi:catechol 2,3-dioxygenase-like lactoylglutathione lyase family enzyme